MLFYLFVVLVLVSLLNFFVLVLVFTCVFVLVLGLLDILLLFVLY